jgi:hypothetical protein
MGEAIALVLPLSGLAFASAGSMLAVIVPTRHQPGT